MTMHDYAVLTEAQRESMRRLYERAAAAANDRDPYIGPGWPDFIRKCFAPTRMNGYVGVPDWCGMFIGIESDGHTHS